MPLLATNLIALALATGVFWWLSAYDARLSGHRGIANFTRRASRCAISLALVECCFYYNWQFSKEKNANAGLIYLLAGVPLALLWFGCLSQLASQLFKSLVDPEDPRQFHPRSEARHLDQLADLIRRGKKAEAIRLCKTLKASGEVSPEALDLALAHLGEPHDRAEIVKPIAAADRLRSQGEFRKAEAILKALLSHDPCNVEAAMQLMRIYAQDLHRPDKARKILKALQKQPHVSAAHLDFARRSIEEWSQLRPAPQVQIKPTGSIDELLAHGFIGTAIRTLEEQVAAEPANFSLRLRLAELHACFANNVPAAERIIRQMEITFSPEQMQIANAKLREWQTRD